MADVKTFGRDDDELVAIDPVALRLLNAAALTGTDWLVPPAQVTVGLLRRLVERRRRST